MSSNRKRVLVVGAGPAGLAAAETLVSRGGVDVDVLSLEPYLGGNASAFRTPDGRTVEQGQHLFFGFYHEMRGLLERSGVDVEKTSTSGQGHVLVWEDRDQSTHHLFLGPSSARTLVAGFQYTGLTLAEKLGFAAFFARSMAEVARGVPEAWDDQCLTSWCLERGFPPSMVGLNVIRASREAQFNWPGEISAYSVLKTLKEMGRDFTTSEFRFPAGCMSDLWWEPVGRRIESLGGRLFRNEAMIGLERKDGVCTALRFQSLHPPEDPAFVDGDYDVVEGSERLESDFDAAIVTACVGSVQQMIQRDRSLLEIPGFPGIARMHTIAPMGLHVWHRNTPDRPPHYTLSRPGPARYLITGLEPPLGVAADNKPFHTDDRQDPRFGAVMHFVGQETGFEDTPDAEILERAMRSLRRVKGYERMDMDGIVTWKLVRDNAPHRRYWNTEPGAMRFKPQSRTALSNLWFAGDWVRSREDFPCMETAVRSGRRAALEVLDELPHLSRVQTRRAPSSPPERSAPIVLR